MTESVKSNVYGVLIDCRENAKFPDVLLSDELPEKKFANFQRNWEARGRGYAAPLQMEYVIAFIETASIGIRTNGFLLTQKGLLVLNDDDSGNGFVALEQLANGKVTSDKTLDVLNLPGGVSLDLEGSGYNVPDFLVLIKQLRLALQGRAVKSIKPPPKLPVDYVSSVSRKLYVVTGVACGLSVVGAVGAHLAMIGRWRTLFAMWAVGFVFFFVGDCAATAGYATLGSPLVAIGVGLYAILYVMSIFLFEKDSDGRVMLWTVPPDVPKRPSSWSKRFLVVCGGCVVGGLSFWGMGHWLAAKIDESRHTIMVRSEKVRLTDEEMSWYDKAMAGDSEAQYQFAKLLNPDFVSSEARAQRSFRFALKSAEQGNANGENLVGLYYIDGIGVETNRTLGVEWQRKAIEHGSVKAIGNMAINYLEGRGVEKDYKLAMKYAKEASAKGSDFAPFTVAKMYYNGWGVETNYNEAVRWYRTAASQGHIGSHLMLGWCYKDGLGVQKDDDEALKWFDKALSLATADRKHFAMKEIALIYISKNDCAKALEWCERTIDARALQKDTVKSDGLLEYYAGMCYKNGWGCKKNPKKALSLLYKSEACGYAQALQVLGEGFEDGSLGKKDPHEAFRLYKRMYDRGLQMGTVKMGVCYWNGIGVGVDKPKAASYFRSAAEAGSAEGQNLLGKIYKIGGGVPKNFECSLYWMRKAEDQGLADAIFGVGVSYYNGEGVDVDYDEAFDRFKKAADKGHAQAMACIGDMYRFGKGVQKNRQTARQWYKRAVEKGWKKAGDSLRELEKESM